ncbi:hypothetical protein [Pseudomonas putida]|uniref:Mobilization protein, MobE n=1 Tax=Pseudomonas putida (strain DOT-T1E) TaxID=1196325 RepID=G0WPD3_PSEPT|nr:hypothetical protein [Pseudomonas putida]AEK25403.1 Mobilization protein, MobE [Pseudomonas putida DOT-T1E]UZM96889.1 hypothetical protein OPZ46_29400 [Pseudomonas putida DOT-T1E]
MDDIEVAFEKLLGRQASDKEVQDLYRVKNALNLHNNDSLWLILMALQSYDTMYAKYPELIARQVDKQVDKHKSLFAEMADAETKKALSTLSVAVSEASQAVALKVADAARWRAWGFVLFALLCFAGLCMTVGFVLGSGQVPYWAQIGSARGPLFNIVMIILNAPVGWLLPIIAAGLLGATFIEQKPTIKSILLLGLLLALSLLSLVFVL